MNIKTAIALDTLADKDWKTQLALGYEDIPKDAIVKVVEEGMMNFYGGPWSRVEWNGNLYWVSEDDIKMIA